MVVYGSHQVHKGEDLNFSTPCTSLVPLNAHPLNLLLTGLPFRKPATKSPGSFN